MCALTLRWLATSSVLHCRQMQSDRRCDHGRGGARRHSIARIVPLSPTFVRKCGIAGDQEQLENLMKLHFIRKGLLNEHAFQKDEQLDSELESIVQWMAKRTDKEVMDYREKVRTFVHSPAPRLPSHCSQLYRPSARSSPQGCGSEPVGHATLGLPTQTHK